MESRTVKVLLFAAFILLVFTAAAIVAALIMIGGS